MSLRAWWSRIRGTLRGDDALDKEMEREMAFHLDMSTQRNIARGMAPEAAQRQARLAFGSTEAMREEAREAYRARFVENVLTDIRFALRGLRRSPSFALTAILTVALGISSSVAIFSVTDAVLFRPLPIPHPDEFTYLGWVWKKGGEIPSLSSFQYEFVREHNRSFAAITTYRTDNATLGDGTATPVSGLWVGRDFFTVLGFEPRLGRGFDASELQDGGPPVVIIGDGVWRTMFGADRDIIGRQVRIDRESRTVVGVMPPEFRFPPALGHEGYLLPFAVRVDAADEGHNTEAIGRFRRGTGSPERDADLRGLTESFSTAHPTLADSGEGFRLFTHQEVYAGDIRRTLLLLLGAVSLLLLIASVNTATLLLVRASSRQREIAVRASIGAGPVRILQQLLTEGLVLSVLSSALGVLLSVLAVRAFLAAAPSALPAGMTPQLDARVLVFATVISIITGLLFGLAAAVPSFRSRLQQGVRGGGGSSAGGNRTRDALIILETCAAVVLLAGATLLVTSFTRLIGVDPGFDADRVVAVRFGSLPAGYNPSRRDQLVERLLERIRALPGIERAAAAPNPPLERGGNYPVDTRERPDLAIGAVELRAVTPDYFATLGIPLVAGRDFRADDVAGGEPVAIVNQELAKRFWGDSSPIDRTIQIGHFKDRWLRPEAARQTRVIGVAKDIREVGLDRKPRPTVLVPQTQGGDGTPVLLVRGTSRGLASVVRGAIVTEEPQLALTIEPLSTVVSRSVAAPRFRMLLIGTFAGSALLLAGIGIYGVIASLVQQRAREIGIRVALGASRGAVALSVVRRSLVTVSLGAVVGLLVFLAVRRVLTTMLFDTSTGDPRLLAIAVAVLAIVATLAAWIPTRRAVRVDPVNTLRME
jgi:putative ABC transport system permease protein